MNHEKNANLILGEIIESATTGFRVQCLQERLDNPPDLGAFVRVLPPGAKCQSAVSPILDAFDPFADPPARPTAPSRPDATPVGTLFAVVTHAETGAIEASRRAAAYGLDEDDLRNEQPQIFDLLCTVFSAVPIGHANAERLAIGLPPRPPRIHAFVEPCRDEEICALTESPDYLRLLLAAPAAYAPDELIAACLRRACECRQNDFEYLVRSGKHLAALLRDTPDRLTALLDRLEP